MIVQLLLRFVLLLIAYIVGSIPTGYIIARIRGISDITKHGSGNIGATNVARVLGLYYFFLIFFLDFIKAFLLLSTYYWHGASETMLILGAIALLIGNGFSVFLNFRGGKSVATTVGILAALSPMLLLVFAVSWLVVFLLTKTVGAASVSAALSLPVVALLLNCSTPTLLLTIFVCVWLVYRHKNNLRSYLNYCVRKS